MIYNPLKLRWLSSSMLVYLRNLPDQFDVFMVTHQCDVVPISKVRGTERWVKSIRIDFMGRSIQSYNINNTHDIDRYYQSITMLIDEYKIKTPINKAMLVKNQDQSLKETTDALGIDNNIDNLPRQLSFHLNDYTRSEREKLIAYLSSVDSSSVDVIINIDFSRCNNEQLQSNSDFITMSNAITNKQEL